VCHSEGGPPPTTPPVGGGPPVHALRPSCSESWSYGPGAAGRLPRPEEHHGGRAGPGQGACAAAPETPVTEPETASEGYLRALAAYQVGKKNRVVDPAIQAVLERQTREPEELFGDGRQAVEELRARAEREDPVDASRARALRRLTAERAGLPP